MSHKSQPDCPIELRRHHNSCVNYKQNAAATSVTATALSVLSHKQFRTVEPIKRARACPSFLPSFPSLPERAPNRPASSETPPPPREERSEAQRAAAAASLVVGVVRASPRVQTCRNFSKRLRECSEFLGRDSIHSRKSSRTLETSYV